MALSGTFDTLPVEEVLGLLGRQRATGCLHLRTASANAEVSFVEGGIVAAHVRGGAGLNHITDWRELIEEVCCRALSDGRGSFELVPEEPGRTPARSGMKVEQVLRAARQRAEQWAELEAVIPSIEAVPSLAQSLPGESLSLDRDQWMVLVNIDGRRTIGSLARRLDLGLLRCCHLLRPLVEAGAVVLAGSVDKLPARELGALGGDRGDVGDEVVARSGEGAPADIARPLDSEPPRFAAVRLLARPALTKAG